MPTNLRPNDLVTDAGPVSFGTSEKVLLRATQPVPSTDQEATIIVVTVYGLGQD